MFSQHKVFANYFENAVNNEIALFTNIRLSVCASFCLLITGTGKVFYNSNSNNNNTSIFLLAMVTI